MKKGTDEQFEGGWHCVVGKHFAAFVTHESERLVMFQMGTHKVLLFKHG
jgi:dynein light chain LC8-type